MIDNYAGGTVDDTNIFANSSNADYGKLYTWATATGEILPADWSVPSGNNDGQFKALNDAMATEGKLIAQSGKGNPVYSATDYENFSNPAYTGVDPTPTKDYNDAPWQGVYSGFYNDGLGDQGVRGFYWSATALDASQARYLRLTDQGSSLYVTYKVNAFALRGVLYDRPS